LKRKPDWLRIQSKSNQNVAFVEKIISNSNLNTVCAEANCPNYTECFSKKIATFMILGKNCTRDCNFCNVSHETPEQISAAEPENLAGAVSALGLKYVVITSVTRDDLADGGAEHFAKTIKAVRKSSPETTIEALIPDFKGEQNALRTVADSCPNVISHNVETVPELYAAVRQQAKYRRSLDLLKNIKLLNPKIHSKSGIMLGMGETKEQVLKLFKDLRKTDCDFLTIGQYLAPTARHYPIAEFITPEQFEEYGLVAKEMGFLFVASAPLVRSSYNASEAFE